MRVAPAAIAAALLLLTGFTDKVGKFYINFPKGWSAPQTEGSLTKVRAPTGATNCNPYAAPSPKLAAYTQAQLNDSFAKPMDTANWADFLGRKPETIEVSDAEARPVAGAIMQIATILVKPDEKYPAEVTARIAMIALPGSVLDAGCYASSSEWAAVRPVLDKTVSSLRPLKK